MANPRPNRRLRRHHTTTGGAVSACQCDNCKGTVPTPAYYLVPVIARRRGRKPRRLLINFECFIEADRNLLRKSAREHGFHTESTTESGSTEALHWLRGEAAAGLAVDLHEAQLPTEDEGALEVEVTRIQSLERHLIAQGLTPSQREARARRYADLCTQFASNPYRLWQWLRYEFPEWVRATFTPED